jgi:hypothetical protein
MSRQSKLPAWVFFNWACVSVYVPITGPQDRMGNELFESIVTEYVMERYTASRATICRIAGVRGR